MPTELRRSFCRVCHAACPIDVEVDGERVVKIHGVQDDPLFEGYTCIKGRQLPDQIHHPDRLRHPLRRAPDGRFEETTSEVALDEIAAKLASIIERHGPGAVADYTGTGGYQNGTSDPVARAFLRAIGSTAHYTSVTIDQPSKGTAMMRMGMWEAGFDNFRDADVLLAVGYNPMVSSFSPSGGLQGTNPFTVLRERKAEGLKLVVVDPRRTELASFADIHLQIRPGEDPTLLAGLLRIILTGGLHDVAFCERWVDLDQLAALTDAVAPFTVDYVAERCDVPGADVEAAAHLFAAGPRGTSGTGTGPSMAPHSLLMEHLSLTLNVVCGRVNREGDTLESGFFLYPDTPRRAQVTPPMDPFAGPASRFRDLRGYYGEMPATTLAEEILTPGDGQVRALIVNGGNPVAAFPDQRLTVRAMEDLELLVVMDHRMTATAEVADYVIAPRLSLERSDVPLWMDRWFRAPYANWTPAVVEPAGDLLNEWEVYWGLANRLGVTMKLPGGNVPAEPRPTDDDLIDLIYAKSRVPLEEIRANRGTILEDRAIVVLPADPAATGRFAVGLPEVIDELAVVRLETTSLEVLRGYDPAVHTFRLISRRLKTKLNSLGNELPGLRHKGTTNYAYLHPDDMVELGVEDDGLVEIASPHAKLIGVVMSAPDVKRGVVSMAHSWGGLSLTDEKVRDIGTPTNRLIDVTNGYDPKTGMAVQSSIPVSVRAVQEDALLPA